MSTLSGTVLGTLACCQVTPTGVFTVQRGFLSISKPGLGAYRLTLKVPVSFDNTIITTGVNIDVPHVLNITTVSNNIIDISTTDINGITSSDAGFWLKIEEVGPS